MTDKAHRVTNAPARKCVTTILTQDGAEISDTDKRRLGIDRVTDNQLEHDDDGDAGVENLES